MKNTDFRSVALVEPNVANGKEYMYSNEHAQVQAVRTAYTF